MPQPTVYATHKIAVEMILSPLPEIQLSCGVINIDYGRIF
jgi:hypothetical protein